jgi:hypothetical protein
MSFNLGLANHPTSRMGGLSSVGVYLYEDIYYRQWITEIALAFYEGRQDEFIWLDLVRQFRNPEKQQILPSNLTKEIIDEVSIMYQEKPIYRVVDDKGKLLKADQKLWEEIQDKSRYHMLMDKLDRWTRLLGTVLVKVSFIDPDSGQVVGENDGGEVQLDVLHAGVYDMKHGASPYYITELLIGFGTKFGGFAHERGASSIGGGVAANVPDPSSYGINDARATKTGVKYNQVNDPKQLGKVNKIYWTPNEHVQVDDKNDGIGGENPYGLIPAVPFFNQDPAHYYFLPINEPLIYANHAVNMRITDLNHIAKFQSFGVPVVKGVERPTSTRQGRPVDDHNILKGGTAQSRFGGMSGLSGFGAGGNFRTFDSGFGIFKDGNADANAMGVSIGPDTAIAVGEKGDFKFAHPDADIVGLVKTIHAITDMVRINHGLRPKYDNTMPASGFATVMEKLGVIEENKRRSMLFRDREQQLFQIIKKLWNVHNNRSGQSKFSKDAKLEITYKVPEFHVDPKTKKEDLIMKQKILDTGDRDAVKEIHPWLSDVEITKLLKDRRKDRLEEAIFQAEMQVEQAKILTAGGILTAETSSQVTGGRTVKGAETSSISMGGGTGPDGVKIPDVKIDNKAKHSEESSKQGAKDPRPKNTKKEK